MTFNGNPMPGVVLEGLEITPRQLQFHDRKFWGLAGISRIYGEFGQRELTVPVIIYNNFTTARQLSVYIDTTLNGDSVGANGTLSINSVSDHAPYPDCTFDGVLLVEGPKRDVAGTLDGYYWAIVLAHFTQLS